MDSPDLETVVRIPWGAGLARTLETYPQRAEAIDPDARQSPAIPAMRVSGAGAVAVLNALGTGYVPAGTLRWWWQPPGGGAPRAYAAPHPFAGSGDALLAVDFLVGDTGQLILLEKVAGADGRASSRLAVVSSTAAVTWQGALDGGPYLRLVPDDAGRLLLLRDEDNALVPLDPNTGQLGKPIALTPGTRAAVAADRGVVLSARHLAPDAAASAERIARATGVPESLVFLFGVDGADDYYTVAGGELLAVRFDGQVRRRLALAGHPVLVAAPVAPDQILSRPASTSAWQVDLDGRVYVPRVTPDAFEVVGVPMRP